MVNFQGPDKLFELTFLDNMYANACIQPDPQSLTEIQHTIKLLEAERARPDYSPAICQSLLHILLQQVQRSVDRQQSNPLSRKYIVLYKNFKQLLDAHFWQNLLASQYADQLHITPHHLNYIVKHVTGKTATQVIRARSILEAKRLLTFSDLSASEIAAQLHYYDSSYFAKLFRAEVGMSPTEFKAMGGGSKGNVPPRVG